MKRVGKIAICLAGGLVLNASLRADDAVLSGNPYSQIVVRNPFGLNPPPAVDPNAASANPPPKITPNGIMTILGQLQVLFKVTEPAAPGKPAADQSYILTEGEAQDDIEVTKIDDKACIVTFNNHGTVQELPLASAAATSAAGNGAMNPNSPNRFGPNGANGSNPFNGGGNFGGHNPAANPGGNPNNAANNASPSGTAPAHSTFSMTPEEQVIMIEAQRQQYQNEGDPTARIMPTTELTPPPDSGDGSTPAAP
jgi:hypothetical protein